MPNHLKNSLLISFAIVIGTAYLSSVSLAGEPAIDESVEPPLELAVELNGEQLVADFNKPERILLNGTEVSLLIRPRPTRTLRLRDVTLEYPAHFMFSTKRHRVSGKPIRWNLEGKDVELSILRQVDDPAYEDFELCATRIFSSFAGLITISRGQRVEMNFGGHPLKGYKIALGDSDSIEIYVELYLIPGHFNGYRYFVFITRDEDHITEEERLLAVLLEKTFRVTSQSN